MSICTARDVEERFLKITILVTIVFVLHHLRGCDCDFNRPREVACYATELQLIFCLGRQ